MLVPGGAMFRSIGFGSRRGDSNVSASTMCPSCRCQSRTLSRPRGVVGRSPNRMWIWLNQTHRAPTSGTSHSPAGRRRMGNRADRSSEDPLRRADHTPFPGRRRWHSTAHTGLSERTCFRSRPLVRFHRQRRSPVRYVIVIFHLVELSLVSRGDIG